MAVTSSSPLRKAIISLGESRGFSVTTSVTKKIREALTDFYCLSLASEVDRCMRIEGPTGSGKTTAIKQFLKKDLPDLMAIYEGDVLSLEVPAGCSPKGLAEAMLEALGDPRYETGDKTSKTRRVGHYLKEKGIALVIFDEAQHLMKSGTDKVLEEAADWLKSGLNSWGVSIAMVAARNLDPLFTSKPELKRRVSRICSLNHLDWAVKEDRMDFRLMLRGVSEELPVNADVLTDKSLQEHLCKQSNGLIGVVAPAIELAVNDALRNGRALETRDVNNALASLGIGVVRVSGGASITSQGRVRHSSTSKRKRGRSTTTKANKRLHEDLDKKRSKR